MTSLYVYALSFFKAPSDNISSIESLLKVYIFAWRLLRDWLPTKTNSVARCIISPEAHLCVAGCGDIESAQHLFLSCSIFGSLWSLVRSWIGFWQLMPTLFLTTLFISLIQLGDYELDDPFYSSFG
ncbi:hypothetical protein QL285_048972 [Trifolium repens]|nr:hypothetical protein QL285_048972 [Trifolium repens]